MTPPRQILPNTNFEVCTRTFARTFRLLPTPTIKNAILYIVGVAAQRYNIALYAMVAMTTHYHLAGRDRDGRLPEFIQYVNSLLARALNAEQGLDDKFWSGDGYHLLRPESADDLLRRLIYITANPVAADLVNRATDYPGLLTRPRDIGTNIIAKRPDFFFRDGGTMQESVELCFEVPPEFAHLGRDEYVALLEANLRAKEQELRAERKAEDRTVMGADRCRQAALGRHITKFEQWFRLRPTIAARVKRERIAAIRALQAFRESYYVALKAWRDGLDALFPVGTWWLPRFAGAAVGAAVG
ncbi:MAG: hypothetical protein H6698_04650 [Myxococcales bacterium]|nr:hypothetical protein [Myxococcales bacterium]MCB9519603.1 hypothetical protein [Myxococcales bacterium]MCB9530670.1 hypothetical protein [Myxococcales bacterium]MCB9533591.1 hypothetical protein [Myxococcales bacterium]